MQAILFIVQDTRVCSGFPSFNLKKNKCCPNCGGKEVKHVLASLVASSLFQNI